VTTIVIKHTIDGSAIRIETDAIKADIRTEGYTSGVAAGTFFDKKTGARDVGFGLSIVDFLLEPADRKQPIEPGQYEFGGKYIGVHGDIPKRYVEGPQICTQAKKLPFEVIEGDGLLVVRQWFTWHQGYAPYRGGSRWEQTLVFTERDRFFFSADRVTTVNECPSLFFRVDMPGHIKHSGGDTFEHIYLSYGAGGGVTLPSTDFTMDFPPDGGNLYQRGRQPMPQRVIRAYQVRFAGTNPKRERGEAEKSTTHEQGAAVASHVLVHPVSHQASEGEALSIPSPLYSGERERAFASVPGPWLAGMTLEPADVYEAWCHQRGYVCLIQELGGWPTRPGDSFGAAYIVGWFDGVADMNQHYDQHRGWSGIELAGPANRPSGLVGVKQKDLAPVKKRA
jgi:hypothetical protein